MALNRFILLAGLALAPLTTPAQQALPLAGIAHVALRVHDLGASIAFYQSLGFEQAFDLRYSNWPYVAFIKINDRQFVELSPVSESNPHPGFLRLCFEGEDLQVIHDDYVSHGLTPIAVHKDAVGNLRFTMPGPSQPIGPDGKAIPQDIEYTQYQEGSLHSKDFGQHLSGDRIADKLVGVALAMSDPEGARQFYINQLSFKPLPGEPMIMHLPGNSGEEVQIVPAALGTRAHITLETANLGRAGRHLGHEHIKFEKGAEALALTDPDGNQIVVRQR